MANIKARFTHDCDQCKFLGHAVRGGRKVDLYKCPNDGSFVVRFGSKGPDYGTLFVPQAGMDDIEVLVFNQCFVVAPATPPKTPKPTALVTRESIKAACASDNAAYRSAFVVRAVNAIYARQTQDEQSNGITVVNNGIGFASCDAFLGKITSEGFKKWGKPSAALVDKWCAIGKTGFPRLAKYHSQLNQIALDKQKKA